MSNEKQPRKRSEKDIVPKFNSGEEAWEYMEQKLSGSWTDGVTSSDKEKGAFEVVEGVDVNDPKSVDEMFRRMTGI